MTVLERIKLFFKRPKAKAKAQQPKTAEAPEKKAKNCSSTVTNFKGWTTVPSEKGNKLNLRLDRGAMVVPRQSASSLQHNAISEALQ